MGAYACYEKADDLHGQRRDLELLSTQARDPDLRDLAVLRLAGLKADQGQSKRSHRHRSQERLARRTL